MRLSRNWLNEFVPGVTLADINDKDFSEAMTLSGSKVEITEDLGAEIRGVTVGRILSMEHHPNSDHMWVCQLDAGGAENVQICTGAWNIHVGDLVPVAGHNSTLPGGVKITKGKLRGVLSCGMLCSLKELGLDERDFPYAVITPAALLNDYHPLDADKPSIPAGIAPGDRVFGKVVCAAVTAVETAAYGRYRVAADLGGRTETLETGCMNIHAGDKLAVNTDTGAVLTPADLRAKQEEFPHCIPDGIFVLNEEGIAPGDDIRPVIGADDHVVEYEITPNRPDCLSVIGLAREAAATFGKELRLHTPEVRGCGGDVSALLDVEIADPVLCPRYTARMVRNVKIAPSPKWMRERLRASGVRPINNIVDITNYVMLEYGQPMHAFDFKCVEGGKLVIRTACDGETIQTLDGNTRKLTPSMLCICDVNKPVCVAGVMGGANSEIVGDTAAVVFESANFNGVSIRRTATALGMRTEASSRYEKGLDPMNTYRGVQRACELVEMLGAGEVVDGILDVIAADQTPRTLKLEPEKINRLLGTDVSREDMVKYLRALQFPVDGDVVTVPSWRSDIAHYSDLAEEVARMYGYNRIPCTLMRGNTLRGGLTEKQSAERLTGSVCRELGYSEILTYSFLSPSCYDKIRLPKESPKRRSITILNPLGEDTSIMRTTALPSMLETLAHNYNCRNESARLYEIGKIYLPVEGSDLAEERPMLSLGAYGPDESFFTLKGAVETVLEALNVKKPVFTAERTLPAFHPGRCARVSVNGEEVGVLGQLHPITGGNYGVDVPLFSAQLDFLKLLDLRAPEAHYTPLPRFPSVLRDIAVVCGAEVPVAALEDCIARGAKGLVREIRLFDVYTGAPIPAGKKSVAFSLTLRHDDHTLTDSEADEDVQSVLSLLRKEFDAVLR